MTMNDFSALIQARHTVRDFTDAQLSEETVAQILEDARYAPSWSNTRGYRIALATGETREKLVAAYLREFDAMAVAQKSKTAPDCDGDYDIFARYPDELRARQVEVGIGLYQHLGITREDRAGRNAQMRRNFEAFGAPVVGLVFIHRDFLPYSALDAGLMLQTLFLSASAHGIDSCPLGVLAGWRRPANEVFNVPADYALVTGFALGYGTDAPINGFRAAHPSVTLIEPK
ncbi:nitroreductase [Arcanobacterium phocae]|uniref:nitroreductase n=1 Tax=Arcanobacterium phocae TaxID=131112 RepID=UPI001C0E9C01|nr:nitroreductase [Arcanobacterium phocae]